MHSFSFIKVSTSGVTIVCQFWYNSLRLLLSVLLPLFRHRPHFDGTVSRVAGSLPTCAGSL